jgi:hypothetical protein
MAKVLHRSLWVAAFRIVDLGKIVIRRLDLERRRDGGNCFSFATHPGITLLARPVTSVIPAMLLPVSCAAKWAGGVRSCNLN